MGTIKLNINPQINPTSLNRIMHKKIVFDILPDKLFPRKRVLQNFSKTTTFSKKSFFKKNISWYQSMVMHKLFLQLPERNYMQKSAFLKKFSNSYWYQQILKSKKNYWDPESPTNTVHQISNYVCLRNTSPFCFYFQITSTKVSQSYSRKGTEYFSILYNMKTKFH